MEWVKVGAFLFVLVVVAWIAFAIVLRSSGTYAVEVDRIVHLRNQVNVVVTVHNTGDADAPSCTVRAWGAGDVPYKVDTWDLKSVGHDDYLTFPATFTDTQADLIAHASASCT